MFRNFISYPIKWFNIVRTHHVLARLSPRMLEDIGRVEKIKEPDPVWTKPAGR